MAKEPDHVPIHVPMSDNLQRELDLDPTADAAATAGPAPEIGLLNGLLATSHDAAYTFADCAEHAQAPDVRGLLLRQADECRMASLELRTQVKIHGGQPDEGGTASGALHRGWLTFCGTLTGYTDLQLLDECARVQEATLAGYCEALQAPLANELQIVLQVLQRHAQRGQDQVQAARELLGAASA